MDEKKTARAEAKYVRIAPRKIQIICDMIRGEKTDLAMAYMKNTPKAGCEVMTRVHVPTLRTTSKWIRKSCM